MARVTHHVHLTDTLTVLSATLTQPNASGVPTAVDLTGKTVEFKMVDTKGNVILAATATGVTVTNASAGEVEYEFASGTVDTALDAYGYFIVTDTGKTDHFPVVRGNLLIRIHKD